MDYGNDNDDERSSNDTEYIVVDSRDDTEVAGPYEDRQEAVSKRSDLNWNTVTNPYEVREQPSDDGNDGEDEKGLADLFDSGSEDNPHTEDEVYGFLQSTDEDDDNEDDEPELAPEARAWTLGEHSTADSDVEDELDQLMDGLDSDVDDGLRSTLEEAAQMVSTTSSSINSFECPVCGLNHGHSDRKHDSRDKFNVTESFADQMGYVPWCHCGVNELAMLVEFFGYINTPIFEDERSISQINGGTIGGLSTINPVVLQDVLDVLWSEAGTSGLVRAGRAAEQAGRTYELNDSELDSIEELYSRFQSIRQAADNAPIPSHVRDDIEQRRSEIEAQVR